MSSGNKPATIYDVARMANVSASTVSRVASGSTLVNEATAERIRQVMLEVNYQPNLAARNLQTRESKTLGVILPDISNPFFSEFFLELEREAVLEGYTVFLCNTMNNAFGALGDAEAIYLRSLVTRQVDGIFFMGGRINDRDASAQRVDEMNEAAARVPLVLINGRIRDVDAYVVQSNEQAGFTELVEYVVSLGHSRIALVGGIEGMIPFDVKHRAFRRVLRSHGIPIRDEWIRTDSFSIESGERLTREILALPDRPSAMLCINDSVAIGALRAAETAGITVPGDLSICGFDDISMAKHLFPSLTTVSHNFPRLAHSAVKTFLRARGQAAPPRVTHSKMTLTVRESTAPLSNALPSSNSL